MLIIENSSWLTSWYACCPFNYKDLWYLWVTEVIVKNLVIRQRKKKRENKVGVEHGWMARWCIYTCKNESQSLCEQWLEPAVGVRLTVSQSYRTFQFVKSFVGRPVVFQSLESRSDQTERGITIQFQEKQEGLTKVMFISFIFTVRAWRGGPVLLVNEPEHVCLTLRVGVIHLGENLISSRCVFSS